MKKEKENPQFDYNARWDMFVWQYGHPPTDDEMVDYWPIEWETNNEEISPKN